jgi:hypothetical protein
MASRPSRRTDRSPAHSQISRTAVPIAIASRNVSATRHDRESGTASVGPGAGSGATVASDAAGAISIGGGAIVIHG